MKTFLFPMKQFQFGEYFHSRWSRQHLQSPQSTNLAGLLDIQHKTYIFQRSKFLFFHILFLSRNFYDIKFALCIIFVKKFWYIATVFSLKNEQPSNKRAKHWAAIRAAHAKWSYLLYTFLHRTMFCCLSSRGFLLKTN